ncbi:MAG: hypothetical protein QXI90_07195, partial [Thermofilum sp.]
LILQHGEVVTFVANPVLEGMGRDIYLPPAEYHDLFTWIGEAWTSNWYALNGQVLDVGDGQVVYQAWEASLRGKNHSRRCSSLEKLAVPGS